MPQISVIIPTYNRADCLEATLDSVFCQSVAVGEVILVDDGSTDETAATVSAYKERCKAAGNRLVFIRQENAGKSAAINNALRIAKGDLIAFNDSDDQWAPTKLADQLECMRRFPEAGGCFTDARFVAGTVRQGSSFERAGRVYQSRFGVVGDPVRLIVDAPHGIFMQTVLVRREVMRKIGGFDERFRVGQDTDFLFALANTASLCWVNEALVDIDRAQDRCQGLTVQHGRRGLVRLETLVTMRTKWAVTLADCDPQLGALNARLLSEVRNELSNLYLAERSYGKARQELRKAVGGQSSPRLLLKLITSYFAPSFLRTRVV